MKSITVAVVILLVCTPLYASESSLYKLAESLSSKIVTDEMISNQFSGGLNEGIAELKARCVQKTETKPYCDTFGYIIKSAVIEVFNQGTFFKDYSKKMRRGLTFLFMDNLTDSEIQEIIKFTNSKAGNKWSSLMASKQMATLEKEFKKSSDEILNSFKAQYEQKVRESFKALQDSGKMPKELKIEDFNK
jgi:hypothetical protein